MSVCVAIEGRIWNRGSNENWINEKIWTQSSKASMSEITGARLELNSANIVAMILQLVPRRQYKYVHSRTRKPSPLLWIIWTSCCLLLRFKYNIQSASSLSYVFVSLFCSNPKSRDDAERDRHQVDIRGDSVHLFSLWRMAFIVHDHIHGWMLWHSSIGIWCADKLARSGCRLP
jgi:hypothetical protein